MTVPRVGGAAAAGAGPLYHLRQKRFALIPRIRPGSALPYHDDAHLTFWPAHALDVA